MSNYIKLAKPYLVTVTVFVLVRSLLEVAGVSEKLASEISLTRLIFVLPVFLGLRFARERLGGFKELLGTSFVYSFWGVFLVMIVTTIDVQMNLGTHYAFGPSGEVMPLGAHLLGHVVEIVVFTLLTSVISWITLKVTSKGAAAAAEAA